MKLLCFIKVLELIWDFDFRWIGTLKMGGIEDLYLMLVEF